MINEARLGVFAKAYQTPGSDRQYIIRRLFDEMGVPGLTALATRLQIPGIPAKQGVHATAAWRLADEAGINVRFERAVSGSQHSRRHHMTRSMTRLGRSKKRHPTVRFAQDADE